MKKTLAIKLKPAAEKAVKQGHPWVWESGIDKITKGGVCGDKAIIFDKRKNSFLAFGLYDPDSPIAVKVLQTSPMQLDQEWISDKFRIAFDKRASLLATDTNSFRWIYGENDNLPGLVLDVYNNVGVLKLYSLIWEPLIETIIHGIIEIMPLDSIVLRLSRNTAKSTTQKDLHYDGSVIYGHLKSPEVIFTEYGLKFSANVVSGHKTGYFLDHRHNRQKVGSLSRGKKVLDVFSYAGGFSVHALAGGATEVTSLDISKPALSMAQYNVKLNKLTGKHNILSGDAFETMSQMFKNGDKYDLIIVDPPSFAKKVEESDGAIVSYQRLTLYAASLIKKGGVLVMASCSSRISANQFYEAVESKLNAEGFKYDILEKTKHDIDHPIKIPEAAYLKSGYYQILN